MNFTMFTNQKYFCTLYLKFTAKLIKVNYQLNDLTTFVTMKNNQWQSQPNSTQRISTLKRNLRSNYSGPSQDQYVNQLARVRLIEDQLLSEKIKNQTLQRKAFEYIQTIAQLEYSIGDLRLSLQKSDIQLSKHIQLTRQLTIYQKNLHQIAQQLSSMNQIVDKKNKECQKLQQTTTKLKQQNEQLQHRLKNNKINRQQQKRKLKQLLQYLGIENQPSFNDNDQIIRDIQLVQECMHQLKDSLSKSKSVLEKQRKENSDVVIKERERVIQLEYQLKLAEKRNQDLEKKKVLESSFSVDKKIEDMIEEMLKKQEELNIRISELSNENQLLQQQLQQQKSSNSHLLQLQKTHYQSQLKQAKQTITKLLHDKSQLSQKLEQLINMRQIESNRIVTQQLELNRKYRQYCEENKRLKLKINQLESDHKMLQKQLHFRNRPI